MFEVESCIRQTDLNELAQDDIFEGLNNSSVLVTGATGLIGSEIVLGILAANRIRNLNIKVVALVRNYKKAQEIFKNVLARKELEIVVQDINDEISYEKDVDYIIHCASNTSSKDFVEKPVETISTIYNGTNNILKLAKDKKVRSVLYLSSLEVYGNFEKDSLVKEDEYGYLDILNPRSSYSQGKRLAETLCISYCKEFDVDIKIARLTQTFGAGISKDDNRVFAQFAKAAVKKENIILHTRGDTIRNYCYLTDAVSAILTILIKGKSLNSYNVANTDTSISIKNMAELVAKDNNISVEFQIDDRDHGYNPTIKICLDSSKLYALGWQAKIGIEEMFFRLISYLKRLDNE